MATHPALRSFEYWAYQYKRTWRASLATGFLSPVLYLAAMGLGLGTLVNHHRSSGSLGGVSYLVFVAPGVLVAASMQVATLESTFPVMGGIKWLKTYHAMLASPIRVVDLLYGHLLWMAVRIATAATIFLAVMAAFGAPRSPEVLLALPVALLTGMAFACPIAAFAATAENDQPFIALFRFAIVPMFLFSGTFFPLSQLPAFLRAVAYVTPLWHGVALARALSLGNASVGAAMGHVAYLVAVAGLGVWWARRTFVRRLAG
jgi:lipooligosaccharide transport system permease protein